MEHLYPILTLFFSGFFGGFFAWIFSFRRRKIEVKGLDIDNNIKTAKFYQDLLDDAMKRLELAIKTINEKDIQIKELIIANEHLTKELKRHKQLS